MKSALIFSARWVPQFTSIFIVLINLQSASDFDKWLFRTGCVGWVQKLFFRAKWPTFTYATDRFTFTRVHHDWNLNVFYCKIPLVCKIYCILNRQLHAYLQQAKLSFPTIHCGFPINSPHRAKNFPNDLFS